MSIDEDLVIVASGDGSPRQSGEERDSLLQVHSGQLTIIQRGIPHTNLLLVHLLDERKKLPVN
jgi:hypothetical protein